MLVTKDTYASVNHVAAAYVGCAKIAGFLYYVVLTRSHGARMEGKRRALTRHAVTSALDAALNEAVVGPAKVSVGKAREHLHLVRCAKRLL